MSYGFEQSLWLKESTVYGTAEDMSAGTRPVILCRPNILLAKTREVIQTGHLRGAGISLQYEDDVNTLESVAGSINGIVPVGQADVNSSLPDTNGFLVLMKHLLGSVTTTGGPVYTHTFYWNEKIFSGFSLAHNLCGATYCYDGLQVASTKLSGKIGGPLEWTCPLIGKSERNVAKITAVESKPAYLAGPPYWLIQHITVKIDSVTINLTGIDMEFANELESGEDKSYNLGSGSRSCLAKSGHTVKGTFSRRHKTDATTVSKFYAKFLSSLTAEIEISLTHPGDPSTYAGKIVLANVKFRGKTPEASDRSWIIEEAPFEALNLDDISSYVQFKDGAAAPVTATGTYDGS